MQAVTPECPRPPRPGSAARPPAARAPQQPQPAAADRPRRPPACRTAAPPPPAPQSPASPANGAGDPLAPRAPQPPPPAPPPPSRRPPAARRAAAGAARPAGRAARRRAPPAQPAEPDPRGDHAAPADGDEGQPGETVALGVEPGGRARVLALVRNQSGDRRQLRAVSARTPGEWWSIFPNTVYLVPFGTGGTYEQEVEIHLHPPRTPEAEARIWDLEVVGAVEGLQPAGRRGAAACSGSSPFEEFETKLAPERASGRKKANFDVAVKQQGQRAR